MIAFILAGVLLLSVTEALRGVDNPLQEVLAANLGKYGPHIEVSTMTSLQQLLHALAETGELFHKTFIPHRVPDYFPDGIKANFNEVAGQSLADVKDDGTAKSQKPVV